MTPTDDRDIEVATALGNINAHLDSIDQRLDAQWAEFTDHRTRTEVYMRDGCKVAQDTKKDLNECKSKVWKVITGVGIAMLGANEGLDWFREWMLR
jgi:hypothetical protein